jgi:translation initiation factor 3 subunit E
VQVLRNDMFLCECANDFIENARQLIFEMFCRIHQKITIRYGSLCFYANFCTYSMLAEKLNMGEEQAERWLVNLIRNAQLNAKIDAAKGQVIMGTRTSSLHEQVGVAWWLD